MKTKIINTPKGRLLVVGGLPEDVIQKSLLHRDNLYVNDKHTDNDWRCSLPDGYWKFIDKLSEVTEEDAKKIVEVYPDSPIVKGPLYLRFTDSEKIWDLTTAKESLLSLVASEVSLENKFGEEPKFNDEPGSLNDIVHQAALDAWEQEQEKVFTNPILFFEPAK